MQGILGLALIVIAFVLLYDVVAGKSVSILGLISGQTDTVSNWHSAVGASTSISGNTSLPIGLTTGSVVTSNSSSNGGLVLNPPKKTTIPGIGSIISI